ncbi:RNA-guided endonuclease InsQ/TnpB family protein [Halocalculus aciditolerans]|uniref:Transposase n=1 Tax=Halocalculus aciditolerans TaxID=1383812 RepID=A0A830FMM9_9EURY|nr:transposase [Halocalculus aciditolerans]GGL61517.1 transposase [Halocalculus aciditolerans]
MSSSTLVKTLVFQLDVEENGRELLRDATIEARQAYNEAVSLALSGVDFRSIPSRVADDVALVRNTTQRIVSKALDSVRAYRENDDYGVPDTEKSEPYPLRSNFGEGYTLDTSDAGDIQFRVSSKPYQHITGILNGSEADTAVLRAALTSKEWDVGTAEALFVSDVPELHITVRNTEREVRNPMSCETVIGVDINEDNVTLTALTTDGIRESRRVEYTDVKSQRHRYLTIRKRIQRAGKTSAFETLRKREHRYVKNRVHEVSRRIVEFAERFQSACVVFEDLKGLRDDLHYDAVTNNRVHRIPFEMLQFYTAYKAAFEGIPNLRVDPAYTSQTCALTWCRHVERGNRRKDRFKCRSCGHQDHADRNASVNIAIRGSSKTNVTVPPLERLPAVRV